MPTSGLPASGSSWLAVINPSGQRTRCALGKAPFLIGRHTDNDLVLRDNRVSRVHARFLEENGETVLEDLSSRAGTFVNGVRIASPTRLRHADTVTFGFPDGYQLIYMREDHDITRLADKVSESAREATRSAGNLGKLRALVEVARALQDSLSLREVLESIVDAALTLTRTERGFLFLDRDGKLHLEVARDAQGMPLSEGDLKVPTRLIQRALANRRELLSMHFDPHLSDAEIPDQSVMSLDLRSVVCVPLVRIRSASQTDTVVSTSSNTAGLLYLDSRVDLADLSSGNREILQTLALEASTILENARLLEVERARHRLEEELRIARHLQQDLLPAALPQDGWFRVAASTVPSQHVGGDYYDAMQLPDDWWSLVVADVSGKGVGSALLASLLQGAFALAPTDEAEIVAMMDRVNRYLYERTEGEKYATIFYAAVHKSGLMRWSNAAHCAPILLHADGSTEPLLPCSMAVGMLDFARFDTRQTQLAPGDRLVVYSDGFSDAQDGSGNYFDQDRIAATLREGPHLNAQQLHGLLNTAVQRFTGGVPQRDDMTLLVVEFAPEQ